MRLFFFFVFISSTTITEVLSQDIGRVTKLRGQVSILPGGKHEAQLLKIGSIVQNHSSVLTSEKSFVQITLFDQSTINIAPNSKSLIAKEVNGTTNNDEHVINLVTGMVRAQVKKREKQNFKVKTPFTVMGIRGTEFVATYTTEHKVTSLVTLNGAVEINKLGAKTKPVMVGPGEFAATNPNKDVPNAQVLASEQIEAIRENDELSESHKTQPLPSQGKVADLNTGLVFEVDENTKKLMLLKGGEIVFSEGVKADPLLGLVSKNKKLDVDIKKVNNKISTQLPQESVLDQSDPYHEFIQK